MSFEPWTLAFQLLNFSVLLVVLFRLLFKPLREIMARREAQIQAALAAAEQARAEAEELRDGLARERQKIERLRLELMEKMKGEVEEERARQLERAGREAQDVLERGRAVLETERRRFLEEMMEQSRSTVGVFAARLLTDLGDPDLHRAFLRRFPQVLEQVRADFDGDAGPGEPLPVELESAFPLTAEETDALRSRIGPGLPAANFTVVVAPGLFAGVRLRARDRLYDFSLRGQLDALAGKLKALA